MLFSLLYWPSFLYSTEIFVFFPQGSAPSWYHCPFLTFPTCCVSFSSAPSALQFSSVAQLCPTLCDPMYHSTPGLPVHHQLPESTQTHVHQVDDAIQPSHPLPSPSPPALNLSQHQDLFKGVSSSNQVAKLLEFQLQHQSFQWTPKHFRIPLIMLFWHSTTSPVSLASLLCQTVRSVVKTVLCIFKIQYNHAPITFSSV